VSEAQDERVPIGVRSEPLTRSEELDLRLSSGRLHAQRFGSIEAPLVIAVHGLSANMKAFDFIGERLGGAALQVVALDLRGRGLSDTTPPGTYGWYAHARDVFEAATVLGFERFSIMGHSMGAAIALQAAAMDAARLERLVLIDACGQPEPSTAPLIAAAVDRLGSVYPSVEAYLERVRSLGTVVPWSDYFEGYLRYELEAVEGGVRARSNREAALEDAAEPGWAGIHELWRSVTMPALLLRAGRELLPGYGFIVGAADATEFARTVPGPSVVEIDANHYGIITADATVAALREFLAA
jgi:pimeloyl-ACP methyl ester carboxylesterase